MAGKRSDNTVVERIHTEGGGIVDVEFDGEKCHLGIQEKNGMPYVRTMVGGSPWVEDVIRALQRVKKKVAKAEE